MRQAKSVPQHDVLVVEVCVWVCGDPGGDALGGLAGGLGDVAAGGVELAVFVWRPGVSGVNRMAKVPVGQPFGDLHLVTCTACLAKPARFQTRLPSLGRRGGTSRLTSLYETGLWEYGFSWR